MPEPSAWVDFPTKYKFIGVDILLDFTFKSINRSTYSVLDFFGDVGGFIDILYYLGIASLFRIRKFYLHVKILHSLFDEKTSSKLSKTSNDAGDLSS